MSSLLDVIRNPLRKIRSDWKKKRMAAQGMAQVEQFIAQGMPDLFRDGLSAALTGQAPERSRQIFERIESIRTNIAEKGGEVEVFYSPKPAEDGEECTAPGEKKFFPAERLARGTSVPAEVGQMIHLVANDAGAKTLIELGACVGIGASYLAAVPTCERFITIEASQGLAEIAKQSVHTVNPQGEVYNEFFNDALDHLLPGLENGIDFAWIDGHHEKTATIHYFERIKPHLNKNAVVAFDDIYWSQDMLDGWQQLKTAAGFSHTVDVGVCGLCLWDGETQSPKQWSLKEFMRTGDWKPLKPAGWTNE